MTAAARLDRARRHLNTPPAEPIAGQLAVDTPPVVCKHGNPQCSAVPTRPYPCGPRCDEHQPSRTRPYYTREQP
ncbi:aromatic ring-opening dioxygenase LigA [Streptomyces sp. NBC_01217]|uniref:aromatic ring-opening dioxygenase LigA n=1 Tax=Streptomyces sp. NBC_01217 TaxID=2903779 RepID=UPI002E14818C|nr:aromatic ring-opening dioxygenase LigA [Streptomyces sp. NBC_01217]